MHFNYFSLDRPLDEVAFDLGPMTPSQIFFKKILEYIGYISFNNFIL